MSLPQDTPAYEIFRAESPIRLDGRLDDAAWKKAPEMELKLTLSGEAPRRRTSARMLYDDQWLYVGFHCEDREIWGSMTGHDDPIYNEEVVEIFLDPTGLLTCYYELEVSPLNTSFDAIIINDAVRAGTPGRGDRFQGFTAWDPVGFKHAVHVEGQLNDRAGGGKFWQCEMAIRFDELFLGVNPRPGDQWRGNLYRIDIEQGLTEESAFSPTGLADFHVPSRFGRFIFR